MKKLMLFIEYHEVYNDAVFFVAPPPPVDIYLSNDVLYPFIIADSVIIKLSYILLMITLSMFIIN